MRSLPIPRTRTDARGAFTLGGVPAGQTAIAIVKTGKAPLLFYYVKWKCA